MSKNKGRKTAKSIEYFDDLTKRLGLKPMAGNKLRIKDGINRNSVRHQRKGQR